LVLEVLVVLVQVQVEQVELIQFLVQLPLRVVVAVVKTVV
tara:strand:+ start:149 stop:268 length:120 start_codon:yes stop_codon:yes gene_type:complete